MTADEKRMQKALLEILAIAEATTSQTDRVDIFYNIGKIQGLAKFHGEWIKPAGSA